MQKILGGVLLVSGTTIGAAMLALPTTTGLAGFYPALLLFLFFWALMTYTAFLMLEVTLWMGDQTNMVTMARRTLGFWGEALCWTSYLFLLYALTTAYLAGSSAIVSDCIYAISGLTLPAYAGPFPLVLLFGYFVFRGIASVDRLNRILMTALVFCYCLMVMILVPYVQQTNLQHVDWKFLMVSSAVIATSFGYHIIIPSLTSYMKRDTRQLSIVILLGSLIPLVIYVLWELVALGVIPLGGPSGIVYGYANDANGAQLLTAQVGGGIVAFVLHCFAFFAIVTSFLGVSISLRDFLSDGLKIKKTAQGKSTLVLLVFVPTLCFMWMSPRAFISALEYAGAYGVMILLGILPALMVWRGRYRQKINAPFKTPGGKCALIAVIVLCLLVIFIEILNELGVEYAL